jgi:hypothetical protein
MLWKELTTVLDVGIPSSPFSNFKYASMAFSETA